VGSYRSPVGAAFCYAALLTSKELVVLLVREMFRGGRHVKAEVFFAAIDVDGGELVNVVSEGPRDEASFAKERRRCKLKNPHVDAVIKDLDSGSATGRPESMCGLTDSFFSSFGLLLFLAFGFLCSPETNFRFFEVGLEAVGSMAD
jgi:hypothetical protein